MLLKGLGFGMLLQLAIGPMCMLVFKTATNNGFGVALSLVVAIACIDALYILLSGFAVSKFISRPRVKRALKIFGSAVLILFGGNIVLGAFGMSLFPSIKLFSATTHATIFIQGLLLTASNPLTIIFWGGVFSAQVGENNYNAGQLFAFGMGCVLATILFLAFVALLGTFASVFLNETVLNMLNMGVGLVIMYFGIKPFLKA